MDLGLSAACPGTALLGDGLAIEQHLRGVVLLALVGASGNSLGLNLGILFFFFLIVAALILCHVGEDVVGQNAQDQEEPKQVDGLQTGKQGERDVLTDPTLVLLSLPVELKGTNGAELGQHSPKDLQVQVMTQVNPPSNKHGEVRRSDERIQVVQGLGSRQEEIRDIVSDVHRQTHVREVEAITQSNKSQGDDVVTDQLLEVLAGLLQLQHQHNRLLRPVTGFEEVVGLEDGLVLAVRESLEHRRGVEVPNRRALHHVQSKWSEDSKVHCGVHLLHEPRGLALASNTTPHSERSDHLLHDELARERQHNRVERHERDILFTLAVHDRAAGRLGTLRVRQEDGTVHGVRGRGVDGVQAEQKEHHDQWQEPRIAQTGIGEAMEERAGASPLCCFRFRRAIELVLLVGMRATTSAMRTFWSVDCSIGLTSFIVDIAGALVSPRMSTPKAELPRGRTMAIGS